MPADLVVSDDFTSAVQGPAGGDPRTATSVRAMGSPLGSRTLWTWNRLQEVLRVAKKVSHVDVAGKSFVSAGHGLVANDLVYLRTVGAGAAPGGTSTLTEYYVLYVDADTVQLAATSGGSAITLSDVGALPLYLHKIIDAAAGLFSPAQGVLPAGSLRAQLNYLRDNWGRKAGTNTWTGSNQWQGVSSFTNAVTMLGPLAELAYRDADDIADAATVTLDYAAESYLVPNVSQNTVINLPAVPTTGRLVRAFRRDVSASAFNAVVKIGGTSVLVLPGGGAGKSWGFVETKDGTWKAFAFGGAATAP